MAIIRAKASDESLLFLCCAASLHVMLARFARGDGTKLLPTSYT
jgi:hypothetical protein